MPRRKTPRWIWAAAVSGAVAALAWVAFGPVSGPGSEAGASQAPVEVASVVKKVQPLEIESHIDEVEPDPMFVDVHVATDPAGATILRGDGSEACASTPCTLEAERGSILVLRAKLGRRKGSTALTPTQEETVLIELKAPKKSHTKPRKAQAPERKRENPARGSDLKVPEWAQ